ncbi:cystathionine gamma-synthase [Curtobacterium flaccumfaciens]|uniref:cystathionine gamma-synthase n=1 Tax=Curtobacterium flaccumfaciens TaxID=2035 RepID=UPI000FFEA6B9|nr:cystathionine gamma-synthase [Curtobacterium flaccumfaciens]MCS0645648.1 cystathionine gamma-synthase [Curtobacterium flaccumfaciens pv. flaccumfaciens]MCS6525729.1 cystathionine gamma-synthase [Curtobacterium flaccumfaciens pv. flaccumfaciens]MCS6529311.1 cystathionine gamma-synthase [Curtobacterium flaccumfaciens pv. flaccumfaciens]NUU10429.1 cystathionine gamma-synthase [Curtobacterium flaccumfaciens]RXF84231.1 cystathionine gamma-synthase [Curtobacterium flaccumfaciens pv. flaccumfacien
MTEFSTRAVHAGQEPDETTGAVIPPIHLTSTYVQDGVGGMRKGYEYSRAGNPTRDSLQVLLADLDGGVAASSFASGLAAEDALLRAALVPGGRVVMGNDVYGGTHRLVSRLHVPWGVELVVVDMSDLDQVRAALQGAPATTVLWVETPTNPLMKIADIAALATLGHESGALVVVDNTFASPYLQQPLSLGADVVVYSTTKYLGGHSDVVGGAVVLADEELAAKVQFLQFGAGAISSPFDAYLTTRGIKTLAVRMERHSRNAQAVAEALVVAPGVERVYYPGLPDHPGHDVAARQMRGFGGMLSVALSGGAEAAKRFAESTELFALAESLGGVESLIGYPSEMTHASVKGTELAVPENVVRLSVGIEDAGDLVADLEQALAR